MAAHRPFVSELLSWVLASCCFVLFAVGCNAGRDKPRDREPDAAVAPDAGQVDVAEHPACKAKCGSECGVDDGCGSKCGCGEGLECKSGVCLDPSCGPCRPNERCAAGKCECVPACEGHQCADDGCGGTCPCPDGLVLDAQGRAVPPEQCKDTCESAKFQCGKLCGKDCGACGDGQECAGGACKCEPKCDGTSCSDGCGGTCECKTGTVCNAKSACVAPSECTDTCGGSGLTCGSMCGKGCGSCGDGQSCIDGECREGTSCSDCGLQLRLLDRRVVSNKIVRVTLGIDFQESSKDAGPRLVDIRIDSDHVVRLISAEAGPALVETGKDLFFDETTRQSWQERSDRSYQLLAYSVAGAVRLKSGRLMKLSFDLAEPGPVRFSLLRHAQTFAPLDADSALQSSQYEQALVVSQ